MPNSAEAHEQFTDSFAAGICPYCGVVGQIETNGFRRKDIEFGYCCFACGEQHSPNYN